ncbi:diguanylate cyclase [bacterium]|nr:diguanylate cyclase [bacterium]MBU1995307.1 diguanylate cyclase [bacterium]
MYDFSQFFKNSNNQITEEFINKYTSYLNISDKDSVSILSSHYKKILEAFSAPFEQDELLELFKNLAQYQVAIETPYVIITNEIYGLKSILLSEIINGSSGPDVIEFILLFSKINNKIAHVYLLEYIKKLSSLNALRLNSISDLIEKNIIQHYESHLLWLTSLAICMRDKEVNNFQLDESMCSFGQWLHNGAKKIIQNDLKYKTLNTLHNNLHVFAKNILAHLHNDEYHILLTYLEKCELLSLSIGTELALIDNIIMNQKVTKDPLTNALGRDGLIPVFENQYELSLATSNPFVLAICDLDYFKNVNDVYGHVAGDEILKLFVRIVKKYIRNSDSIIRYGGEEFVIVLPAVKKAKGLDILEKIRKCFENTLLEYEGNHIKSTVSMGVMEITPEYYYKKSFLNEYINIVDKKLYLAKNSGRNKIEVY